MSDSAPRQCDDDDLGSDVNFQEFEQALGLNNGENASDNGPLSPMSAAAYWTDSSSSTLSHIDATEESRFMPSPSMLSVRSSGSLKKGMAGDRRRYSSLMEKAAQLKVQLNVSREELNDLRQDAGDLQEYSNAKLTRVTRYLGVLAERARTLDQAALAAEQRIAPLKEERKKLFNNLLNAKGLIRVFCRVRPQFENEGGSATSFPNSFTVQVNQAAAGGGAFQPANAKRDYEFDHVFGPHIAQGVVFENVQPVVQSVLDGFNASVMAYGQTGAGKTHTMEGPSHDRGLFYRAFDELFDLANSSLAVTSKYAFHISVLEFYKDKMRDLLGKQPEKGGWSTPPAGFEMRQTVEDGVVVAGLTEEKVENPVEYAKAMKAALQNRGKSMDRMKQSHLLVTIHVRYTDTLTGEQQHSKLHLADLAGSERLLPSEASGDRLTASLFVNKSLSALGDCLSTLTAKKGTPPFANSKLTLYLSDSLAGESKVILLVLCSPGQRDAQESVASLNFATRARNVELSLGSRDTIKKWRDMASEARQEACEKERQAEEFQQEVLRLQEALRGAEQQAGVLFEEVQRSWAATGTLQAGLFEEQTRVAELQAALNNEQRRTKDEHARCQQEHAEREEALKRQLEAQEAAAKNQVEGYEAALETQASAHRSAVKKLREDMETRMVLLQAAHADALQKQEEAATAERSRLLAPLEVRIHQLQQQLAEATAAVEKSAALAAVTPLRGPAKSAMEADLRREFEKSQAEVARLKEELKKGSELTDRLHQENERLVKNVMDAAQKKEEENAEEENEDEDSEEHSDDEDEVADLGGQTAKSKGLQLLDSSKYWLNVKGGNMVRSSVGVESGNRGAHAITRGRMSEVGDGVVTGRQRRGMLSPAAEQLMVILEDIDFEQFDSPAVMADRANRAIKQFLAAIASEPGREAELVAEMRDAMLAFLGRLQGHLPLDASLVARVRLLYLKAAMAMNPELRAAKVPAVEAFLEKEGADLPKSDPKVHTTTPAGSPGDSPIWPMTVSLKPEKKLQKFLSFGSKSRNESSRSRGESGGEKNRDASKLGKVNDLQSEARAYGVGNRALAILLAHADHDEIKRRIRRWLAEKFDHLPLSTGPDGELGQLTKAILDGWIEGSGAVGKSLVRDSLGNLLGENTRRTYLSQLQHLTDLSSSLAAEEVDDLVSMNRLRSQLESVELKRRKALREMQADPALLAAERDEGLSRNPREEARLASLFVLEDSLNLCQEVKKGTNLTATAVGKKRSQVAKMVAEKVPIMLPVDRAVAERHLAQALRCIEIQATPSADTNSLPSKANSMTVAQATRTLGKAVASTGGIRASSLDREIFAENGGVPSFLRGELVEWHSVTFNSRSGAGSSWAIKCGATSKLDLVVKLAVTKGPSGPKSSPSDIYILPHPTLLDNLGLAAMTKELEPIPEALKSLVLAKNAVHTRERYSRLFKTLAARIPAMQKAMGAELADYLPGQKQSWSSAAPGEGGTGGGPGHLQRAVSTSGVPPGTSKRVPSQSSLLVRGNSVR